MHHLDQEEISTFETDSFTLVDVNLNYKVGLAKGLVWDVFVRGSNLADEDARRATSFRAAFVPLAGASFHVGVRGSFN